MTIFIDNEIMITGADEVLVVAEIEADFDAATGTIQLARVVALDEDGEPEAIEITSEIEDILRPEIEAEIIRRES